MISSRPLRLIPLVRSFSHSSLLLEASSFKSLDQKWIQKWKSISHDKSSLYPTKHLNQLDNADPFYCLSMFPYPSGILHMGHLRVYTISDVIARFKRLQGYNVIHPMGWDAFGLPAENAAVERGIDPSVWTTSNIAKMKEQMELMLADFDWEREVNTSSPDYYKWTQKIFLLLHEHGLAYRKKAEINWDPVDKTVLANEQVDSEGRSWRSGAIVEKRNLEQWFIGITKFAPELNKDLEVLKEWPEKVKLMQKHWIGESHGAEITFPTENMETSDITVFTSRPDTLFSVQFLALALNHPIVVEALKQDSELAKFIKEHDSKNVASSIGDDSKEGYKLPHVKVSIPIDTQGEKLATYDIPVYAAPYVLGTYGHGAVMGCPGHDQRDFDFWKLHNPNAPIISTIGPKKVGTKEITLPFTLTGTLYDNSVLKESGIPSLGKFNGLTSSQAKYEIIKNLERNEFGNKSTQYRIRDWLISRQRYWGAPIPIIHCESCGPVPVPDKDLPVLLPKLSHEEGDNKDKFGKGNPLANMESFVNTTCPSCGSTHAKRDTDTMDTFMDSSWYFFRYTDPKNTELPFSKEMATKNMPINMYIGGVEHAILHLLYSRFILKFLGSIGMWESSLEFKNEPIKQLVTQGMVHGKTFKDPKTGRCLKPDEIKQFSDPLISFEKMSKSKYNGADPSQCIEKYGADATRAHMLFLAPISDILNWNEEQIAGVDRWLRKVMQLGKSIETHSSHTPSASSETYNNIELNGKVYESIRFNETEFNLFEAVQKTIAQVTKSIENDLSFNTIISDYMKLTNTIIAAEKSSECSSDLLVDSYTKLLVIMSPVTPATSEECWESFQALDTSKTWGSIFAQRWPIAQFIETPFDQYNVYVNGKARFVYKGLKSLVEQDHQDILREVLQHERGQKFIVGDVKKMIVKPGTLSFICK